MSEFREDEMETPMEREAVGFRGVAVVDVRTNVERGVNLAQVIYWRYTPQYDALGPRLDLSFTDPELTMDFRGEAATFMVGELGRYTMSKRVKTS